MDNRKPRKSEVPEIHVVDDWPEHLPITEAELALYETHLLDIIATMAQHD